MIGSTIHFDGLNRTVIDAFALDMQRVLMLLACDDQPTLAVTGTRYKDSGLFTGMKSHHRVENPERFAAKLEILIDIGFYDE
jgi:hypothetical protein